ncbi:hypothetical protein BHE90_011379 [Fusarium euwallaceae]|uniref:Uncharacterized protein n=3 Tax=Fusarium solani species complex TaxID=232080 RepID=A0A3M2RTY8_9HYPO|nr:hypothetical protein CDV36_011768 [Fusarium kuroshium]RSL97152.1 hypothetical protein CDV31_013174 [Fusarium ambrosium]RTE74195.1 hypothetical protein BHE90_011379 [Fusarium euwallaceae]
MTHDGWSITLSTRSNGTHTARSQAPWIVWPASFSKPSQPALFLLWISLLGFFLVLLSPCPVLCLVSPHHTVTSSALTTTPPTTTLPAPKLVHPGFSLWEETEPLTPLSPHSKTTSSPRCNRDTRLHESRPLSNPSSPSLPASPYRIRDGTREQSASRSETLAYRGAPRRVIVRVRAVGHSEACSTAPACSFPPVTATLRTTRAKAPAIGGRPSSTSH